MKSPVAVPAKVLESLQDSGILDIWEKIRDGTRLGHEDGLRLFETPDVTTVGWMANVVRERLHGDRVYFNRNLHINATNVCEASCVFCSFARLETGDADAWTMELEQAVERVRVLRGDLVSEVHIVNGLNPDLPYSYYLDLLRALKVERPELHCKGFTAVEVHYYAEKYGMTVEAVLRTLGEAGLDSMPGGGAEIFADRARRKLCDDKVDTEGWLEVHRVAHRLGFRTNATMLFGSIETLDERVDHLVRLRELQDESQSLGHAGFQTFIPLRFHNEHNRLARLASPTGYDSLRTIAVSRLMLDNFAHVKAYWLMLGMNEAQAALWFGASDLDGTVREEHIYHMAGAETPAGLSRAELVEFIERAGRTAVERDSLYRVLRRCDDGLEDGLEDGPVRPVSPEAVKVGWVNYGNALPLVRHLEGVALRGGHPSEVARWLREGEVDLALLPVGALLAADAPVGGWRVVPDVCIGSEGAVESVLLAAETPPESWTRVLLDGVSRTSVLLARLLLTKGPLADRVGEVEIVEVPPGTGVASARGTTATVVIGDAARALPARLRERLDLAAEWTAWTGLPFVFAVWAGRADLPQRVVNGVRQAGLRGLAEVRDGSFRGDLDEGLWNYLRDSIRYQLDDRATTGLLRFEAMARQAGLLRPDAGLGAASGFSLYDAPLFRPRAQAVPVREALDSDGLLSRSVLEMLDEHAQTMDLLVAAGARRRALFGASEATYGLAADVGSRPTVVVAAGGALPVLGGEGVRVELHVAGGETAAWRAEVLAGLAREAGAVLALTVVADQPHGRAVQWLRTTALARLALPGSVHIEGSWQGFGRGLGQVVLHAGADDFGAAFGEEAASEPVDGVWPMTVREAERNLRLAGLEPAVRDGGFVRVGEAVTVAEPAGRPLRRLTPMASRAK